MALIGRWGATSLSNYIFGTTWAAANGLVDTQRRNDSSTYTFSSVNQTITLPSSGLADGYLFAARMHYSDSSNGRFNPQLRIIQSSGTGTTIVQPAGGYSRDNNNNEAYVHCWTFVDGPSASAAFQLQAKRDSDSPNTTDGPLRTTFEVIPLYYADAGMYSSTSAALYGGTTPNQVTGFTGTDGTNITLSSNVVTVTGDNKRYLVLGGTYQETSTGSRTQRWGGLEIDGTLDRAAMWNYFLRNNTNGHSGGIGTRLIETATASRTIEMNIYRGDGVAAGQGGADVDGTNFTEVGAHSIVVLELHDSAEVISGVDDTGNREVTAAGPTDQPVSTSTGLEFNDSASFTRASDTVYNAETAMDALVGLNAGAARESGSIGSGTRFEGRANITVNGTEDVELFHGNFNRGNQGTQDTHGHSYNILGFVALALNDDLGWSTTLSGQNGGGDIEIQPGWSGMWALNLDTLEDTGSPVTVTPGAGSLTLAGYVPDVARTDNRTAAPDAGSLALTGEIPTVSLAAGHQTVEPGAGSLALAGYVPTVSQASGPITVEPPAGSLAITGYAPARGTGLRIVGYEPTVVIEAADGNITIQVPAGSLSVSGEIPAVQIDQLPITVAVPSGGLVLTGYVPTVAREDNHVRAPPAGALALTGHAPSLDRTENWIVQPPAGSLSLAGYEPAVAAGDSRVAQPPAGALTLAGHVPVLDLTENLSTAPAAGELTLAGYVPTVTTTSGSNTTVEVPAGSLTITGYPNYNYGGPGLRLIGYEPTVLIEPADVSETVTPGAGSLALTGYEPTVLVPGAVAPDAGSLAITGHAPAAVLGGDIVVQPPAGSLTITGEQADFWNSGDMRLIITGHAPTVVTTTDQLVLPDAGSLVLAGYQPTVIIQGPDAIVVAPEAGSLVLAGHAPTIDRTDSHVVRPDAGSLVIRGRIPTIVLTGDEQEGLDKFGRKRGGGGKERRHALSDPQPYNDDDEVEEIVRMFLRAMGLE